MPSSQTALQLDLFIPHRLTPPVSLGPSRSKILECVRPLFDKSGAGRLVCAAPGDLTIPFGLGPKLALIINTDPHLHNLYVAIQRGFNVSPNLRCEKSFFEMQRRRFNHLIREGLTATDQAAELFYYLAKTATAVRMNAKGSFSGTFGERSGTAYETDLSGYRERIAHWTLAYKDYQDVDINDEDFLYAEPLYDAMSLRQLSFEDHKRLALWLSAHSGPVVVAEEATDANVALYSCLGFRLFISDDLLPRASKRGQAQAMLAVKNIQTRLESF